MNWQYRKCLSQPYSVNSWISSSLLEATGGCYGNWRKHQMWWCQLSICITHAYVICTELELNVYLALDIRHVSMLLVAA